MSSRFHPHVALVEGDTLYVEPHGDITLEQAQAILSMADGIIAQSGRYYAIVNLEGLGKIPPDVRRWVVEWSRSSRATASAFFGGSVATRAVMSLLTHAIAVLRGRQSKIFSAAKESEARSWLAAERAKHG